MRPGGENGRKGSFPERSVPSLLVVEQMQSTRELMGLVLQRQYRTQTAATYEQALRRVRAAQFDGIVVSVTLRGEEAGVTFLEAVRAVEGYAAVPIILLIDPSLDEARKGLAHAGADAFLRRPFVRSELFDILNCHVNASEKKTEDDGDDYGHKSID